MTFDFGAAVEAKAAGKRLTPGIKNAKFMGITFANVVSQSTGDSYKTMALKLDVEGYGEYTQNFFEPQSKDRSEMNWGVAASPYDHFQITVREIYEALDPEGLMNLKKLTGTFKQIVDAFKALTDKFIGKEVKVKFIPDNRGYSKLPNFPAKIDNNGNLAVATYIIGQDISLNPSEVKKINAAQQAKPTDMANRSEVLSGMAENLNGDSSDDKDDLPFGF